MEKFYLFYDKDMFQKNLFTDLEICEDVTMSPSIIQKKDILGKMMQNICTSIKLNTYFKMPFRKKFYTLNSIQLEDVNNYFIFTTESLLRLDEVFLNKYREEKNVKFVLVILDSFHAETPSFQRVIKKINKIKFDLILTYDKNDAKEFGYSFLGLNYYSKFNVNESGNIKNGLYFVGGVKGGRKKEIEEIAYIAEKYMQIKFDIFGSKSERAELSGVQYIDKWMDYKDVVKNVMESNCILEFLQQNQKVQTIRYFEAVCYNKKLLTNNPDIVKLPFYNPQYMKIFEKIEDIDWEWVKTIENIDYGYRNEFSPIYLLDKIKENME